MFEDAVYNYIDIAFPIVHGTNVEDGTLQGYLKMFNIPYVGCDVISSSVGMDKYVCKCLLKDNNIPVLDCKCYTLKDYNDSLENIIKDIEEGIPYPVIVKPVNLGSSVGIEIARRYLESLIALEDNKIDLLNFYTYVFLGYTDLLNGTFDEAMSIACAQGLKHLIYFYDDNNMSEDGPLSNVLKENIIAKYSAMGMFVDTIKDSHNIKDVTKSIEACIRSSKPSLIIVKNVIGKDTFNEGKNTVYSGVLSFDDVNALRRKYNLFLPQFEVSKDSVLHVETQMNNRFEKNNKKWQVSYMRVKDINSPALNEILGALETHKNTLSFASENFKINDGYREPLILSNYKVVNLFANK
jgi:hypothetical protein